MKKYFATFIVISMIAACGNDSKQESSSESSATINAATAAPADELSANPDYQKGLGLIAKSDCLTCHKISEKLVGPAYRDVAAKYTSDAATISMLADKVVKGGTGVWGQIPMAPHPAISKADAEQMVKYVLLLKNK